jgi:hypothetical protein
MWCGTLPFLMDHMTDHNDHLLVAIEPGIVNGNIFFSSWAALTVSLLLATSLFEIVNTRQQDDDKHLYLWVGFAVASLVVMSTATRLFGNPLAGSGDCQDASAALSESKYCSRTVFGIVLGAFSAYIGFFIVWLQTDPLYTEPISLLLLMAWGFAVSYLTIWKEDSPGANLGTLYFGTWFALLFIFFVAIQAFFNICQAVFFDSPSAGVTPPTNNADASDAKVIDGYEEDENPLVTA